MGSYENIVKIEEMKRKVDEGDLLSAQKILDTIEIKKVKNVSDLNLMAEVFKQNDHFDEAAELYLKIYEKSNTRKTLFQMVEISILRNNTEDAEAYLLQYQKLDPEDFYNYIFRYRIDRLKGEPYEKLIDTLVELKKTEYIEQWAYELAKLYYKAGMEQKCIQECSDIALWFGEGVYVEKAKMLRSYFSGENGKDKIMEELKRRSETTDTKEAAEEQQEDLPESDNYDTFEENQEYIENTEDIYTEQDFMADQEAEELENGLGKDVQNILTNAEPETEPENSNPIYEDKADEQVSDNPLPEVKAEEDENGGLLFEDDEEEDDRKLDRIAEELQINPEELFGDFLHEAAVKSQLVKSLEAICQENTKSILMIITGTHDAGKTALAKSMALFMNRAGKLKSSKVARISGEKLNKIDIAEKKETLRDCCLLIENASELSREAIENILELTKQLPCEIAVIFEEDKKNMKKLFRTYPELMSLLKIRLHL